MQITLLEEVLVDQQLQQWLAVYQCIRDVLQS
jgi:hypothetical protein